MRIFLVSLIILSAVALGLAFRFNRHVSQAQTDLNQERYLRMTAEENLEKANAKIVSLEGELAKNQNKSKSLEKVIDQTSAMNKDLQARLEKANAVQEDLEKKIKQLEPVPTYGTVDTNKTAGEI